MVPWDFRRTAKAIVASQTQQRSTTNNTTTIHDNLSPTATITTRGDDYESSLIELNHWVIEPAHSVGVTRRHHHPDSDNDDDDNDDDDYAIYLAHPPILVLLPSSRKKLLNYSSQSMKIESLSPSRSCSIDQDEIAEDGCNTINITAADDYAMLLEEIHATTASKTTTTSSTNNTARSVEYYYTEWSFNILLHTTWRVPTLYFSCCHSDGTPLCRREVLDTLLLLLLRRRQQRLPNNNDNATSSCAEEKNDNDTNDYDDESSWEFISQEEHPITGKPSYFLHPCRTAERMELMMSYRHHQFHRHHTFHQQSGQQVDSEKTDAEAEGDYDEQHRIIPLLTWMSMILPVVGCKISPEVFCRVRRSLLLPSAPEEKRAKEEGDS